MDQSKVVLFFHTVRYLKLKQIYYRFYYALSSRFTHFKNDEKVEHTCHPLNWSQEISTSNSYNNKVFTFLNLEYKFDIIDWNFADFGKLWTYNLNYFDFLNQDNISKEEGLGLIEDYINNQSYLKDGLEPYPISLRVINWIKFLSKYQIQDAKIDTVLFKHLALLNRTLEYHLLGNHLLENAFALLFGSYYFRDERIYKRAKNLLETELNEQILKDGAHFELSPMYHQIILTKVLDCIHLVQENDWRNDGLKGVLESKASEMGSWLSRATYSNGDIPKASDSAYSIAVSSEQLFNYAKNLKLNICQAEHVEAQNLKLSDSGYRKWELNDMELFMDIGKIGPDYIPGHAHADTFNFELYYKGNPIIVDTGISTYEKNSRRQLERSTESHNTIRIDETDSSEVWGGFRVARRAKIIALKESENTIEATHNGYKRLGAYHSRSFNKSNGLFIIEDRIESNKTHQIESFLHFHPDCEFTLKGSYIEIGSGLKINIVNAKKIALEEYDYCLGFNKTKKAKKIRALVEINSRIEISQEEN
jgi:hypothetical protein